MNSQSFIQLINQTKPTGQELSATLDLKKKKTILIDALLITCVVFNQIGHVWPQ